MLAADADERPCRLCGGSAADPRHGGYYSSEVANQHEYEPTSAGDDDPRPPASGAMHPDYPQFAALAARLLDDQLCEAIGVADSQPLKFQLQNLPEREAFISAMADEVVRRLEGRRAA